MVEEVNKLSYWAYVPYSYGLKGTTKLGRRKSIRAQIWHVAFLLSFFVTPEKKKEVRVAWTEDGDQSVSTAPVETSVLVDVVATRSLSCGGQKI